MTCTHAWSGRFRFGDDWACFEGLCGDAQAHRHLAAQVVIGVSGPVMIRGERGAVVADAIMIAPGALHAIVPTDRIVRVIYLQGFGRVARSWGVRTWPATPWVVQAEWGGLLRGPDPGGYLEAVSASAEPCLMEPRLAAALQLMRQASEFGLDLGGVAQRVGLSPARLRALARAELGAPLAHWRTWLRLERAIAALRQGEPLAAAAALGGFSDQAHLSRTMRRFFGITPWTASRVVGAPRAALA